MIVLAQQLVERRSWIIDREVSGGAAKEAVSHVAGADAVETIGAAVVINPVNSNHSRAGVVLGGEIAGRDECETFVAVEVVVSSDLAGVVNAKQLGKLSRGYLLTLL